MDQKTGTAAILAILAGAGSWMAAFTGHAILGMVLAVVAVILGIIGTVMAVSPRVSGGILSIFSIVLGCGGFILSVLVLIGKIIL